MSKCMNALAGNMYTRECPQLTRADQRDADIKQLHRRINALITAGDSLSAIIEATNGNCNCVEKWENAVNYADENRSIRSTNQGGLNDI